MEKVIRVVRFGAVEDMSFEDFAYDEVQNVDVAVEMVDDLVRFGSVVVNEDDAEFRAEYSVLDVASFISQVRAVEVDADLV